MGSSLLHPSNAPNGGRCLSTATRIGPISVTGELFLHKVWGAGPGRDLHSSVQTQSHPGPGGGARCRGSLVKLTRKISDRGRVKDIPKRGEHSYTKPHACAGNSMHFDIVRVPANR